MNHKYLDTLWFQAQHEAIEAGEPFTRYRFAALVAADRDALRHRVRELEEAMRLCGIDHSSLIRIATAIRGSAP